MEDQYRDDDALERYLQEENLALVPLDFMRELMVQVLVVVVVQAAPVS